MNTQTVYILVAIAALAVVALLLFVVKGRRQGNNLTPLAGLAFACILAGILFNADRLISYGLMGIGVGLAVIDMFISMRKRRENL